MVDAIEDVALIGLSDDPTLRLLIGLAVNSADNNLPVFPDMLDEPMLWPKFMKAVAEARNSAKLAKEEVEKQIPAMPKV